MSTQLISIVGATESLKKLKADIPKRQDDVTTRLLGQVVDQVVDVVGKLGTLVEKTDSQGKEIDKQKSLPKQHSPEGSSKLTGHIRYQRAAGALTL